jgi:hypothetical protein
MGSLVNVSVREVGLELRSERVPPKRDRDVDDGRM